MVSCSAFYLSTPTAGSSSPDDCAFSSTWTIAFLLAVMAIIVVGFVSLLAQKEHKAHRLAQRQLGKRLLGTYRVSDKGPRYSSLTCFVFFAKDESQRDDDGDPRPVSVMAAHVCGCVGGGARRRAGACLRACVRAACRCGKDHARRNRAASPPVTTR